MLLRSLPAVAALSVAARLLPVAASAQTPPAQAPTPAQPAPATEQPGSIEASRFLPPELLDGPDHHVAARAFNDGFDNTYFLRAGTQELEVTGTMELRRQIREFYAIAELGKVSKTGEFEKAIAESGKQKIGSVTGVIRNPVGTLKNVPKGASRFFGRVGEGLKGGHGENEGNALQGLTGVWRAKVQLAMQLGVDPYSPNPELQRALLEVARASAGGGLLLNLGTALVGGPAGAVLTGVGVNETLQQTLANSSPDDLRILNRKKLFALGIDRATADAFLMHPWFSPVHETVICDALATLGVDPSPFLAVASQALTAEDALYFTRLALVLRTYHTAVAPLQALRRDGSLLTALDRGGILVIPLSCDYAIWSERVALRAGEFRALAEADRSIQGLAVAVDGEVSDRFAAELRTRQIGLSTRVLGPR